MRKRFGMTLLVAMLVAPSAAADDERTADAHPPVPFQRRYDIGLSAGLAYPWCDNCSGESWGLAFGGYLILRPWPGFGFGPIFEAAIFEYRVGNRGATGWQWLLTPVMRGTPLRTTWLDGWLDGGIGLASATTHSDGNAHGAGGWSATVGAGLMLRAGSKLRIGPYARASALAIGRTVSCGTAGGGSCGGALPAHIGAYTLGFTVGIVLPGEVGY